MNNKLTILFLAFLTYSLLLGITINVPAEKATIQSAIDSASNGDLVLVQPGTYVENINFNGKNITVASMYYIINNDSFINSTIIDGNQNRVVLFNNGEKENAILEGFKITNGDASDPEYLDYGGGGIKCINSSPSLRNLIIDDNTGMYGAGLSFITSNSVLDDVIIEGNDTLGQLCYGGGINISQSNLVIRNSIITGNDGDEGGGGINCELSTLLLENVLLYNNTAFCGGAIQSYNSNISLTNVIISDNSSGQGGAYYCSHSDNTLTSLNSICWNNEPEEIYIGFYDFGGPFLVTINCSYSTIKNGQNGIEVFNGSGSNFVLNWGDGNIENDPLFVDTMNDDYHLSNGSPCLSTATPSGAPSYDLDGRSRPLGSGYDIGCYEQYDDGSLPVTLSSFTALFNENAPQINWTTQSETDNLGYNIYRSVFENGYSTGNFIQINTDLIDGMGTCTVPTDYQFIDEYPVIEGSTYWYWLESLSLDGDTEIFGPISLVIPIQEETPTIPIKMEISNYPNPFNPSTTIEFYVQNDSRIELSIYNVKGQEIKTLVNNDFSQGKYSIVWNGDNKSGKTINSGIYYYKLYVNGKTEAVKKCLLLK
ncbi:MAG: T9SS type A sorting domain-containing protein [Candidatus Atribacteria bacterium]|nr:T9SS type A sorting domain-containing protein [Candidatus Atribacteria bacterium]